MTTVAQIVGGEVIWQLEKVLWAVPVAPDTEPTGQTLPMMVCAAAGAAGSREAIVVAAA